MLKMLQKKCCPENMATLGLVALRVVVGIIFIKHGWDKWQDMGQTTAFFASQGIPLAKLSAYLVGTVELIGGLMVLLGIYAKEAAKFLVVVMVVALLVVHTRAPWARAELPLALLGGALAISGLGAGPWRLVKKECCYEGKMKK